MGLLSALGLSLGTLPLLANATCNTITARTLTLVAVDCNLGNRGRDYRPVANFSMSSFLQAKRFRSAMPPQAQHLRRSDSFESPLRPLSGWTTDFVPALFGGQDNLGTVTTQLTIVDQSGNYTGKLFTRDTIDLSQITTTGSASEEDVIVGGTNNFEGTKGTYRVNSAANQDASVVILTNLNGVLCTNN